jgi:hypothetical protein
MYYKRDDKFAPLGYGGINGSKLRQCIWLVNEAKTNNPEINFLLSGSSVKSPQLPMGSAVAKHFGMESAHVIGATNPISSIKLNMVEMASWFGAGFDITKIAYNAMLQKRVKALLETPVPYTSNKLKDKTFYLEYGITLDHKNNLPQKIHDFHYLGANQVRNIPKNVDTVIIPFGSANSATSVLFGLFRFNKFHIKNVYIIGIGPSKIKFLEERLKIISIYSGIDCTNFLKHFEYEGFRGYTENKLGFNLFYDDLHGGGYVDYQDEIKFSVGNIELHPTYEAKVMKYITEKYGDSLINEKSLFWIVGSKPYIKNMLHIKDEIGEVPKTLKLF